MKMFLLIIYSDLNNTETPVLAIPASNEAEAVEKLGAKVTKKEDGAILVEVPQSMRDRCDVMPRYEFLLREVPIF